MLFLMTVSRYTYEEMSFGYYPKLECSPSWGSLAHLPKNNVLWKKTTNHMSLFGNFKV